MAQKVIELNRSADPGRVMDIARSTVESRNYLWEPTGPTSALAHEGGRPITRKASASKLLLEVRLDGDRLVLGQGTTGAVGFAANMGLLVAMKVSGEFRKVRKAIEAALDGAGVAA